MRQGNDSRNPYLQTGLRVLYSWRNYKSCGLFDKPTIWCYGWNYALSNVRRKTGWCQCTSTLSTGKGRRELVIETGCALTLDGSWVNGDVESWWYLADYFLMSIEMSSEICSEHAVLCEVISHRRTVTLKWNLIKSLWSGNMDEKDINRIIGQSIRGSGDTYKVKTTTFILHNKGVSWAHRTTRR